MRRRQEVAASHSGSAHAHATILVPHATEMHAGTVKQSEILKHTQKTKHPRAKEEGFEILATNYPNRTKRKLAEAMFIRDLKPTLNRQKDSYKLHLFA